MIVRISPFALINTWAITSFVTFVVRSTGLRTTDTVSKDSLEELIRMDRKNQFDIMVQNYWSAQARLKIWLNEAERHNKDRQSMLRAAQEVGFIQSLYGTIRSMANENNYEIRDISDANQTMYETWFRMS